MDFISSIRRSTRRWRKSLRSKLLLCGILAAAIVATDSTPSVARQAHHAHDAHRAAGPQFAIVIDPALHVGAITGRLFVFVSQCATPEPRLQYHGPADTIPLFGRDVERLRPGNSALIDASAPGYPIATPRDIPPGDYTIQALANVYTRFPRADGHTIWAHRDRGEGQQFTIAPGNLVSTPMHVRIDPARSQRFVMHVSQKLPAIAVQPDTPYVKHIRFVSPLLSKFWGVPIALGAVVLLPRGYAADAARRYPAVYVQDHFSTDAPLGFDPSAVSEPATARDARLTLTGAESPYEFTQGWLHGDAPPIVAITFQHPTPYYDDSYAVNSANNGPYGDAIVGELIPLLEARFALIPSGRARFLLGGSTGGWEALALQIQHPDFFNGAWSLYPDPVDFHRFQIGDLYADTSAFTNERGAWITSEIPAQRTSDGNTVLTMREESRLESVLGSHGRSTEQFNAWDAAFGPVSPDGYPREIWNKTTGVIDRKVVESMRARGFDLHDYLARNWRRIGPHLVGKIHVDVGDADDFFLNLACYRLAAFLDATTDPPARAVFSFGRPGKGHGWQAKPTLEYLREMAIRARP